MKEIHKEVKLISINKHSFEIAKNRLKNFSEKQEKDLKINKVSVSSGIFDLFDHTVTGAELNSRLVTIQNFFIELNSTINKTIKEFREIYNALDALDNDYIKAILLNLELIHRTNSKVEEQQKILQKQHSKLEHHQDEIEQTVNYLEKFVRILTNFKEDLDQIKHLNHIDEMWKESDVMKRKLEITNNTILLLHKKLEKQQENLNFYREYTADSLEKITNALTNFTETLDKIEHLSDIDEIWEESEIIKKKLEIDNHSILSLQGKTGEMQEKIVILETKLKRIYYLIGSTFGIAIVWLIFTVSKVI